MIDVFISPTSTWHPPVAPPKPPQPPPGLNGIDLELFKALQGHGRYGSLIWPLLNEVAAEQKPELRLVPFTKLETRIHWYCRKYAPMRGLPKAFGGRHAGAYRGDK